ncbi:MAG TPA: rod shape-determining protein MreC [Candidatus Paceibacterota bacterium]|nr:rod shape-determining protein MreC [Candidatus Paceibacterota bacterium]
MSSFKPKRYTHRQSLLRSLAGVGATVAGILLLWFVAQKIFYTTRRIPPIDTATLPDMLLSKRALVKKIASLQATIDANTAALVTAEELRTENDQLKAALGRTPVPTGVLAHVMTPPNRSFYDTMLIDAGTDDGVNVGQVVYTFDTIALGTVTAVAPDHATVLLFSAPGQTTSGSAQGSNVAVTLIGRGGGEYEVRIPRDVNFSVGDVVTYQSVPTAVIAQIAQIITDPRDPFQRLIAKAPVNLQTLKWVTVR